MPTQTLTTKNTRERVVEMATKLCQAAAEAARELESFHGTEPQVSTFFSPRHMDASKLLHNSELSAREMDTLKIYIGKDGNTMVLTGELSSFDAHNAVWRTIDQIAVSKFDGFETHAEWMNIGVQVSGGTIKDNLAAARKALETYTDVFGNCTYA